MAVTKRHSKSLNKCKYIKHIFELRMTDQIATVFLLFDSKSLVVILFNTLFYLFIWLFIYLFIYVHKQVKTN